MFSLNHRPVFAFAAAAAAAVFSAVTVTGCGKKVSPAVGTWTGKTPLGTSATLILAADGTGSVSVPPIMQNKPVTWKEGEDKKIELILAPASGGAAASGPAFSAFLGDESKTMTLAFPNVSVVLSKAADAGK